MTTDPGRKDDHGKLSWSLLPLEPVREILGVLHWAAFDKKPKPYGPDNWQRVENARERYYNAAQRHLTDWWRWHKQGKRGKDVADHESGFHVLAHVGCCVLFLLWFELTDREDKTTASDAQTNTHRCGNCGSVFVLRDTTGPVVCPRCGARLRG